MNALRLNAELGSYWAAMRKEQGLGWGNALGEAGRDGGMLAPLK